MDIKLETLNNKKEKQGSKERFALNSGERQIGKTISDIRKDHVVRYELVGDFLSKNVDDTSALFGGDIFCGNGYGSNIISQRINCFSLGFDASAEAIALANNYFANEKLFFSVKKFPFFLPSHIFDFIVSFETIEHLVEDISLIEVFETSLKKGGYLFLSAPNEEICSYEKNNYQFHIKHYTFSDIINILKKSGCFELISWYGNGAYNFENGVLVDPRKESEMILKENILDSHITYIFKKIKN